MFAKCKEKIKGFSCWIWQECKDVKTLGILLCVVAVVYSPVWGGYLLHAIFGWKWASVMASACLLFWAGPFTPFFPICIGITLSIKRRLECHAVKCTEETNNDKRKKLSYSAIVCGGVTIGAGSVVTKGIPPMVVAAGNPCKVIQKVTATDKIPVEGQNF